MVTAGARPVLPTRNWRRRHIRLPGVGAVANSGQLSGRLLNLARSGLALETNTALQIGRRYRLKVELEEAAFWTTARVRWCVLRTTERQTTGEVRPVYHAGLSMEESDPSDPEELLDKLRRRALASSSD